MKQYIWFHPTYISQAAKEAEEKRMSRYSNAQKSSLKYFNEETHNCCDDVSQGQIKNAITHGYLVLNENELGAVSVDDHLTIVGKTTLPTNLDFRTIKNVEDHLGFLIQGETSEQLIKRLTDAGLKNCPRILSLECCKTAVADGLAQKLSSHLFLKGALIEANNGGIGRDPSNLFRGLIPDSFGRVVMSRELNPWVYFRAGKIVKTRPHSQETIREILAQLEDYHDKFFKNYTPGWGKLGCVGRLFGIGGDGRAGRYFKETGTRLTEEKANELAEQGPPDSAVVKAIQATRKMG